MLLTGPSWRPSSNSTALAALASLPTCPGFSLTKLQAGHAADRILQHLGCCHGQGMPSVMQVLMDCGAVRRHAGLRQANLPGNTASVLIRAQFQKRT